MLLPSRLTCRLPLFINEDVHCSIANCVLQWSVILLNSCCLGNLQKQFSPLFPRRENAMAKKQLAGPSAMWCDAQDNTSTHARELLSGVSSRGAGLLSLVEHGELANSFTAKSLLWLLKPTSVDGRNNQAFSFLRFLTQSASQTVTIIAS